MMLVSQDMNRFPFTNTMKLCLLSLPFCMRFGGYKCFLNSFSEMLNITSVNNGFITSLYIPQNNILCIYNDLAALLKMKNSHKLVSHYFKPCILIVDIYPQYLAAGADRSILVWDIGKASKVCELKGHTDTIYQLMFSRDGTILASGMSAHLVLTTSY